MRTRSVLPLAASLAVVPLLLGSTPTPAWGLPATVAPDLTHAALATTGGAWVSPLEGPLVVVRGFDPPATDYGAGHRGVDLLADAGAEVRAAGAGRVSYAGRLAGKGVVVVVHGSLRTTYEPVTASVSVGDDVTAGERIGWLEAVHPGHRSCDPGGCLHWGLRRGDTYLDPMQLLRRAPSVLLPVPRAARPAVPRAGLASVGRTAESGSGASAAARPVEVARTGGRPDTAGSGLSTALASASGTTGAVLLLGLGAALVRRRRPGAAGPSPEPPAPRPSGPVAAGGVAERAWRVRPAAVHVAPEQMLSGSHPSSKPSEGPPARPIRLEDERRRRRAA